MENYTHSTFNLFFMLKTDLRHFIINDMWTIKILKKVYKRTRDKA